MSAELPGRVEGPVNFAPTRRFAPSTLRAAGWAALSLRRARWMLRSHGVSARIPFPPRLPIGATRGVMAVLRRTEPTCLERATVLQTWLAAHDTAVDIIVGVAASDGGVTAHAWIDLGVRPPGAEQFREIYRIQPPHRGGAARTCPEDQSAETAGF